MAYTNQRLLLRALLKGLDGAVRSNDESAADRYRVRISLIAGHFETNRPISDALERLLYASGQWLGTKAAERYEAEREVLRLIDQVVRLL